MINHDRWRRGLTGLMAALALLAAGCSRGLAVEETALPAAGLTIALDKDSYRPGEPVQVKVALTNTGSGMIRTRRLDASSVKFIFSRTGDPEPMEREAVHSRDEPLGGMIDLAAGAGEDAGPMSLVALYEPNAGNARQELARQPEGVMAETRTASNVAQYEVAGAVLFEREASGLITREQAIKLAGAAAGSGAESAEASGAQDEKGFDRWLVKVQMRDGTARTYLVNPYTGRVTAGKK